MLYKKQIEKSRFELVRLDQNTLQKYSSLLSRSNKSKGIIYICSYICNEKCVLDSSD